MKLLNNERTELAVLNESTTKLLYWGKYPVILYYSSKTDHGETVSRLATITKIEALDGYIETDAGNLIKLEGTVNDKISTLESLIGTKIGYVGGHVPTEFVPHKTVTVYKELDNEDSTSIIIKLVYDTEKDPLEFKFLRSENAVTVKDIISKVPEVEGFSVIGLVPDGKDENEANILKLTDKLLEDQTLTAVYGECLSITIKRGRTEDDTEEVKVNVPYQATVEDVLNAALENEVVQTWINDGSEYEFENIYRIDGSVIGTKAKNKSATMIVDEGLKLGWTVKKQEVKTIEIAGGDEVNVGDSIALTADVENVSWISSNDEIATVDETGLVTGVTEGEVIITASSEGYESGSKIVTVNTVV